MAYSFTNEPTAQLASGITAGSLSFTVQSGQGAAFPATGPFIVKIDTEFIEVGSRSGDTFSGLTRAVETALGGGGASSHSTDAAVSQPITAGEANLWHQKGSPDLTDADMDASIKDGAAGTASLRTLGTGAQQAAAGNDSRLSDARTPLGHHATHEPGGTDALDLTKIFPSGASLPTLPDSAHPVNSPFVRTGDDSLWFNLAGTWTEVGSASSYTLPDATTSAIGGMEADQAAYSGTHPTAITLAPAASGDTSGATDQAALQALVTAMSGAGNVLRLRPGSYYINTGLVTPTGVRVVIEGMGMELTSISVVSSTAVGVKFASQGCELRDLSLYNHGATTPTAGAGVGIDTGVSSNGNGTRITNVNIDGFYRNIDLDNADTYWFTNCYIGAYVANSIRVQNNALPDGGDGTITGCYIGGSTTRACNGSAVLYQSGGGLRFVNNKIVGAPGHNPTNGFELSVADGINTGNLLLFNNSIENFSAAGIYVHLSGSANTGTWENLLINNNEIEHNTSGTTSIKITPEAAGKIKNIISLGNTLIGSGTTTGYSLANVDTITIGPNSLYAITTALSIGSGVTNLTQPATTAAATTGSLGVVEVDNNSSGTPVAITAAGYLSSLTHLTHANLDTNAGITAGQLSSGVTPSGYVATADGAGGVSFAVAASGGGQVYGPLTDPGNGTPSLIFTPSGDVIMFPD